MYEYRVLHETVPRNSSASATKDSINALAHVLIENSPGTNITLMQFLVRHTFSFESYNFQNSSATLFQRNFATMTYAYN